MTPHPRLAATAATAGLLILGIAGPAAAGPRDDDPSRYKSDGATAQEATAVEYGLLVGLIAVA